MNNKVFKNSLGTIGPQALRNNDTLVTTITRDGNHLTSANFGLLSEKTHHYLQAATSENTRKAYTLDIRHFTNWGGLLPATSEHIIHYLHDHAEKLNSRTLSGYQQQAGHFFSC